MKSFAFLICLGFLLLAHAPRAEAAELKVDSLLRWTDQIGDLLKGLDEEPVQPQRIERDWNTPSGRAEEERWQWQRGETVFRPWFKMKSDGGGAGLILKF